MDNPFISPTLLSLCPGSLGLERGLERAIGALRNTISNHSGQENWPSDYSELIKVAAFVEIEAVVAFNLAKQMELGVLGAAPIWTDVKTFQQVARHFRGKVHGITGGYPCQPFSLAGKRKGTEDPRHLWPYIKGIIGTVRPIWCFFENVPGHLELGYREVKQDLESLGYAVEEGIFSAQEVGATHQRKRLFILAVANSYRSEQSQRRRDYEQMFGFSEEECQPEHSTSVFGGSGEVMADTEIKGWKAGGIQRRIEEAKPEHLDDSSTLDHSIDTRLQGYTRIGGGAEGWKITQRSIATTSLWPAPPGPEQYDWEEPRTIESGVGFTVNGYNFTEDLLRIAGNAVVEQTAELAFLTLLEKTLR